MTIDAVLAPSVFDAGARPSATTTSLIPTSALRVIADTRRRSPIAIGRYGPEVLSYDWSARCCATTGSSPQGPGTRRQRHHLGSALGPGDPQPAEPRRRRDHRLRRLVSKAFSPRAAERLRTLAAHVITELVEEVFSLGRCDVVADMARSYPTRVICALLGAPPEDWQLFSGWVEDIKKVFEWNVVEDAPTILAAFHQQDAYLEELIARRRACLTDDLISDLIRAECDGDRLSHDELLMLCSGVLGAGTDTTRNQLAAAVQVLCAHPDQWDLVARNPELALDAVHELMRYRPIIFGTIRRAAEDIELAGVRIPAGTLVAANTASANRDPDVFEDPERLDITRQSPAPILSFGGGVHYCLGAHLARLELTEALRVITQRMPNPRQTGPSPWKGMAGITGPLTVPLEFDAGH